ncbi:DivIVA domain-containing protein [Homoserinimonas sp. OAct 916]|uniref:DivIVA domain-containing protein n=1 Tax=Homoserinimonas sp. OAct 916 TaxID=2211450 RepID=UPI000DBE2650|nr:DivIVA domain-containing protein [Homoserinimonas sp. OAct 916]
MALTPEDVVNKRFQPTKFREGYDQDEVDDFLDEVVVELRRLNQENEELRQRLIADESRFAELQRSGAQPAAQSEIDAEPHHADPVAAVQEPVAEPVEAETVVPEPVQAAPVAQPAAYAAPTDGFDESQSTNNLLQLARRLHDEHVKEGAEKRDSLIAEGHATAARVVAEAESKQREQMNVLEAEKSKLEHKIDELRTFEREYRQKLRGYIEGQLHELDASASSSGLAPANAGDSADEARAQTYQGFGG